MSCVTVTTISTGTAFDLGPRNILQSWGIKNPQPEPNLYSPVTVVSPLKATVLSINPPSLGFSFWQIMFVGRGGELGGGGGLGGLGGG